MPLDRPTHLPSSCPVMPVFLLPPYLVTCLPTSPKPVPQIPTPDTPVHPATSLNLSPQLALPHPSQLFPSQCHMPTQLYTTPTTCPLISHELTPPHTYLPCPNYTITLLPASPQPIQQYAYLLQPTLILWRPSSLDPTHPYHTHSPCLTCSSMTQTCLPQPNLCLPSCLATTGHITPLHISPQQPQHAILLTPAHTTSHISS